MSIISRQSSSRELSQFDNVGDLPTPISSQGYQGSSWKKIDILKQLQGNYPRPEERQFQENAEEKRKESIGSIFKKNVSNSPISNSKPPRPLSPNILEYLGKSSKAPAQNVIKPFSINYDEGWKEDQNVKENGGKSQFLRRTHNTISENVSTYKPKSVVKPLTYESPYEVREALGKLGTTTPSFGLKQMREEETQFNELAQEEKQINFDNHRQVEGEFSLRRDQELKGRNEFNGKEEASSIHKNTGPQERKVIRLILK